MGRQVDSEEMIKLRTRFWRIKALTRTRVRCRKVWTSSRLHQDVSVGVDMMADIPLTDWYLSGVSKGLDGEKNLVPMYRPLSVS